MRKTVTFICGFLLIFFCLLGWKFQRKQPSASLVTVKHTIIPGDPAPVKTTIPTPKPIIIYQDTGSTHIAYAVIDTQAILKDYLSHKVYQRVLKDDSSALAVLIDSVYQNSLHQGIFKFQNRRPTSINTTTILPLEKPRLKVFAGINVGKVAEKLDFGPSVLMVTPGEVAYQVNYGLLSKDVTLSALWKLRFRTKLP